ncbi:unnamed protein product [Strongylus vulgaris]|uniref:Protein kinase domain-containing protein n=1 Tax=Strongylus vulgaris TaxID=40348 RepID=A0A3P7IXA4_STRVU|nr:unnamed protein product [Strongylus vulgaris]
MLVDIGRGGAYLESNRHVHRDLAARNCLISSRAPHPHRVTKIGALHFPPEQNENDSDEDCFYYSDVTTSTTVLADFGLARGVYNSDYYKVHGEDFLPLRKFNLTYLNQKRIFYVCEYLRTNQKKNSDDCFCNSDVTTSITVLADFGLARGVYNSDYYKVHGEDFLPLRWLAPECILQGVFSSKSDVWAFGVLMYEIVGMGQKPYHNMDNNQVWQNFLRH